MTIKDDPIKPCCSNTPCPDNCDCINAIHSPKPTSKCQACEKHEEQWVLEGTYTGDVPYHVCSNCLIPLVNLSLTKKQFKNLLKNGHKDDEYLLHGDFYDEQGNALQPRGR